MIMSFLVLFVAGFRAFSVWLLHMSSSNRVVIADMDL